MTYESYVGLSANLDQAAGAQAVGVWGGVMAAFGEPPDAFFEAVSPDPDAIGDLKLEWRSRAEMARSTGGLIS